MEQGELETLNYKRRAIFYGLSQYLEKDAALQAIDIWSKEFSDKPVYALQPFLSRIFSELNIRVSRTDVQQTITKLLMLDPKQLPDSILENETQILSRSVIDDVDAIHIIFSELLKRWLDKVYLLNRMASESIQKYIFSQVTHLEMDVELMFAFKKWLVNRDKIELIQKLGEKEMQTIFHFAYVASCEYLGPTKTDQLIADVVRDLEALPESSIYHPRNFF